MSGRVGRLPTCDGPAAPRIIELDVESYRAAEAHARRKKREGRTEPAVAAAAAEVPK